MGQPGFEERYRQWSMHAFDTTETPVAGSRSGEWIAASRVYRVAELPCVEVIARCLAEIRAGRWPE